LGAQVKGGLSGSFECKQSHLPLGNSEADLCCFEHANGNSMLQALARSLTRGGHPRRESFTFFAAEARFYRQKSSWHRLSGKFRRQFSILQFSRFFTKTCALL
jgi:hypothetical protein